MISQCGYSVIGGLRLCTYAIRTRESHHLLNLTRAQWQGLESPQLEVKQKQILFQPNHLDPFPRQRKERKGYQRTPRPSSKSHLLARLTLISNYADRRVRVDITYAHRLRALKRLNCTAVTAIFSFTSSEVDGGDSGAIQPRRTQALRHLDTMLPRCLYRLLPRLVSHGVGDVGISSYSAIGSSAVG